jgi:hypothetical protein
MINTILSLMVMLCLSSCKNNSENVMLIKMHTDYKQKADQILIKYPKRSIEGYMLADAYIECYKEFNIKVPLELALAQAQLETSFGRYNANNPYNIRSKKHGYNLFKSPNEGILKYYKLLCTDYLSCRTEKQLLLNFVNCSGKRYAESKTYEKTLRGMVAGYKLKFSVYEDSN